MKTLSMLLFTTILICLAVSCQEESSNCADVNSNGEYIEWSFNDETFVLDFDFNFTLQSGSEKVYNSPLFTLEQGETKDNFGLGITKE